MAKKRSAAEIAAVAAGISEKLKQRNTKNPRVELTADEFDVIKLAGSGQVVCLPGDPLTLVIEELWEQFRKDGLAGVVPPVSG